MEEKDFSVRCFFVYNNIDFFVDIMRVLPKVLLFFNLLILILFVIENEFLVCL